MDKLALCIHALSLNASMPRSTPSLFVGFSYLHDKGERVGKEGTPDKPCGGSVDANPKTCCQTIHDCQKVVPLHYESEWQYKYV